MKFLATTNDLRRARNIVSCGYCELQYPLQAYRPVAYTKGVYGWKADVYLFDDFTLVTGYNTPKFALELPRELIDELNNREAWLVPYRSEEGMALKARFEARIWAFIKQAKEGLNLKGASK